MNESLKYLSIALVLTAMAVMGCDSSNTVRLTRRQLGRLVDLRVKLAQAVSPRIQASALDALRKDLVAHGAEKLKQDYFVSRYAQEKGISVQEELVKGELIKIFGSKKNFEKRFAEFSKDEQAGALELMRSDVLLKLVRDQVVADAKLAVDEDEVKRTMRKILDYNGRASATNELVFARATNCWEQISSKKLTFEEAAKRYDQSGDKTEDRSYWGEFPLSALSEEPVLRGWLLKMKPGDITPPIECDNGLAIVQLIAVVSNEKSGEALAPTAYYQMNRIFFELPLFYDQPTEELVRAEMMKKLKRERFAAFLKEQCARYTFIDETSK